MKSIMTAIIQATIGKKVSDALDQSKIPNFPSRQLRDEICAAQRVSFHEDPSTKKERIKCGEFRES